MKELTIEQKAKAYDEAFRIAQELYNDPNSSNVGKGYVCTVFHELKESEDERIRKELINYFIKGKEYLSLCSFSKEEILAWLEKQGNPQVRTGPGWVDTIDNACDERYAEEYSHGEYCHEQSFKWGFQEGVEWLEKQDEQNSIEEPNFFDDFRNSDIEVDSNEDGLIAETIKYKNEKQGEQKYTDKVEPKLDEIEISFGAKDSELQEATYHIPKGFHAEIDGNKVVIKKGEQKSAWSEEDEHMLRNAIWYVENPTSSVVKNTMLVEWLKDLKCRVIL